MLLNINLIISFSFIYCPEWSSFLVWGRGATMASSIQTWLTDLEFADLKKYQQSLFDICTLRLQSFTKYLRNTAVMAENSLKPNCVVHSYCVASQKPPPGASVSGWAIHVIVTCVDNVKCLCFRSTAERAHQVHASLQTPCDFAELP